MKGAIFLTIAYIKHHIKQTLAIILAFSLLIIGLFVGFIAKDIMINLAEEQSKINNGLYAGLTFQPDNTLLRENLSTIQQSDSGIVKLYDKLFIDGAEMSTDFYFGSYDENSKYLQPLEFSKGTYPTNKNEIAIEKDICLLLDLEEKLGQNITIKSIDNSGNIHKNDYILVGIIASSLIEKSKNIAMLSFDKDSNCANNVAFPSLIVCSDNQQTNDNIILWSDNVDSNFFISYGQNSLGGFSYEQLPDIWQLDRAYRLQVENSTKILMACIVIFGALLIFGGMNFISSIFQDRKITDSMLIKIGLKKSELYSILISQGTFIWLLSAIISTIIILLATTIFKLNLSIGTIAFSYVFSFIFTVFPFLLLSGGYYSNLINSNADKKGKLYTHKFSYKFPKLWHYATKRENRVQNILLQLFNCIFVIVIVGGFYAIKLVIPTMYESYLEGYNQKGIDYEVGSNGAFIDQSGATLFQLENFKLPKSSYDTIKNITNCKIEYATGEFSPLFIIDKSTQTTEQIKYLTKYDSETSKPTNKLNEIDSQTMDNNFKNILSQKSNFDYLKCDVYSKISTLIDENTLQKIEPFITSGKIDKEKFFNLEEIIVDENAPFMVGDIITIALVDISKNNYGFNDKNGELSVTPLSVKVSAKARLSQNKELLLPFQTIVFGANDSLLYGQNSCISIDSMIISQLDNDKKTSDLINKTFLKLKYFSNVEYENYKEKIVEYYNLIDNATLIWFAIMVFFSCVIVILSGLMIYIKIKSKRKSYSQIVAIGCSKSELRRIIMRSGLVSSIVGIFIGLAVSYLLIIVISGSLIFFVQYKFIAFVTIPLIVLCYIMLSYFMNFLSAHLCTNALAKQFTVNRFCDKP